MRVITLLAAALVAGCTSLTGSDSGNIFGSWMTEPEALQPRGWMQYELVLAANGQFSMEVRSYGVYGGQTMTALSSYNRHEGRFEQNGSRLEFHPKTYTWWDSFYGVAEPTIERPSPYNALYDDATYDIQRDRLILHYTTFPADAPVPTQQTFYRTR